MAETAAAVDIEWAPIAGHRCEQEVRLATVAGDVLVPGTHDCRPRTSTPMACSMSRAGGPTGLASVYGARVGVCAALAESQFCRGLTAVSDATSRIAPIECAPGESGYRRVRADRDAD